MTLHLTPERVWAAQQDGREYTPEAFAEDGFIHCTDGEARVVEVGNRYYRGDPRPYVLLDIDLSKVAARAVYDDELHHYPHIYGSIERAAILRVRRVHRDADGAFLGIDSDTTRASGS